MSKPSGPRKDESPAKKRPTVSRLEIRGLFGEYDYDIVPRSSELPLLILYGDNGLGKTTVLKLLYHMLSPVPYGGHRKAVGETLFRSFAVYLSSGHVVTASRKKGCSGIYRLHIEKNGVLRGEYTWHPDEKKRDMERAGNEREYASFCEELSGIGATVHFLSDSRKALSFQLQRRSSRNVIAPDGSVLTVTSKSQYQSPESDDESWLQLAIRNAVSAVRSMALAGTNRGYESANTIYKEIVERIVTYSEPSCEVGPAIRQRLQERFKALSESNAQYEKWGLTSTLEVSTLEELLSRASSTSLAILDSVLTPYLDGIQARLDALAEPQRIIATFASVMTEFYNAKEVRLHVSDGISVVTNSGQPLRPQNLSSGEQQLMLLMCNAIIARSQAAIFAIDEPELSLNVKWQRKLVTVLLDCLSGTSCQVVLATHSIELLARYREHVVKLTEITEEESGDDR